MRKLICGLVFGCCFGSLCAQDNTVKPDSVAEESALLSDSLALFDISFEDLINLQVTTASKTAERAVEAPAVLSVITKQEIELYGALTLGEILERVTSVFMLSTYSATQNVASFRGDQTGELNTHILILVDGRPTRESIFNGSNASLYNGFPIESIERIEVIRGPGSVLYGTCAMMGVINIITKTGGQSFGATAGYGTQGTFRGAVNGKYGKKDWEIQGGAQFRSTDGWTFNGYDEGNRDLPYLDSIPKKETTLGAQLKFKYKGLKFNSFYTSARQSAFGTVGEWQAPPDYEHVNSRLFADLGYERQLLKFWKASLNVTFNRGETQGQRRLVGNDDIFRAESNDILVEFTNYLEVRKNINLVVGGVFNSQGGDYYVPVVDERTNLPFDITLGKNPFPLEAIADYQLTQTSVYLQADYKPFKWLKLIGGAQGNKVSSLDIDFVPRLGTVINPIKPVFIKALYGSAFRAASGYERRINFPGVIVGRDNVQPEKVTTLEAQIAYAKTTWSVGVTYFLTHQTNLIRPSAFGDRVNGYVTATGEVVPRFYNVGHLDVQGIEVEANANLASLVKGLSVLASFTYQMNDDDAHNENVTLMPNQMLKFGVSYKSDFGLRAGWFNSYFGSFHEPKVPDAEGKVITRYDNPAVKNFMYGTLNVGFDISTLIFPESKLRDAIGLDVYLTNLYNQKVYYPEIVRGRMNTIEGRGGFGLFARLSFKI